MRPIGLIAISCVALALSGCITTMDVQKVKSAQQLGIQYSLPVPILQVCPGPAGTIAVQEIYLPDQDNRYGISAKTYAAKFNLNVELTKEGFLKKLDWNPDSTAVAEKVAESAGNIAKAKIEADAKAAEEVAKKEAEAAKTRKDALATAEKAVNDAEADLRVAAATLAALRTQPNATPAQIVGGSECRESARQAGECPGGTEPPYRTTRTGCHLVSLKWKRVSSGGGGDPFPDHACCRPAGCGGDPSRDSTCRPTGRDADFGQSCRTSECSR